MTELVNVLDPTGKPFTVDPKDINPDFYKNGWKLDLQPIPMVKPSDVNPDGTINVLDPSNKPFTVAPKDIDQNFFRNKWMLQSQADMAKDPLVKQNIDLVQKAGDTGLKGFLNLSSDIDQKLFGKSPFQSKEYHELLTFHRNDEMKDADGNYLMSKDGIKVPVPSDQLAQARAAGYEFADHNFEALYKAHQYLNREPIFGFQGVQQFGGGAASTVNIEDPISKLGTSIASELSPVSGAREIASLSPEAQETYANARTAGVVAGIAGQLLAPELGVGKALGTGIKSAQLLEEFPLIASALAHGVQGATMATPQIAGALISGNPKLAAESAVIGALGGILFGEGPNMINKLGQRASMMAEQRLPAAADKALASMGASADIAAMEQASKLKLMETLSEAGLKEASTADKTLQVLSDVSSGKKISVLGKLDQIAEDKILTGHLSNDLMTMVRGEKGLNQLSPELEESLNSLNQKMDKLFPNGTASLSEMQKVIEETSAKINQSKGEIANFNAQAKDLMLNEFFKMGDQAALKADTKTAALWAEQKGIAQAANDLQNGFRTEMDLAATVPGEAGITKKLLEKGAKTIFRVAGGALGHAAIPIPYAGGIIGHELGKEGFEAIKPFLNRILPDSGSKNWILKNVNNPNLSSYYMMNAIHNTNVNLSQIPEFIKNPAIKTALFANQPDPIKNMLGPEANGLSKSQQFDRLSNKVSMLAGNDQMRGQYLDSVTSILSKNHPEMAQQLKAELNNKIMAANQVLHQYNMQSPQAFQKQTKFSPNKEQMDKIEAGLNAIDNPYSILEGIKNNKINKQQVQLVQQLHPAIYQEMVNNINKEAYSGKTELSLQQRLSASLITGQPMDASLKNISALQATYNQSSAMPAPAPKQKKEHKTNLHADKIAGYTTFQRIRK